MKTRLEEKLYKEYVTFFEKAEREPDPTVQDPEGGVAFPFPPPPPFPFPPFPEKAGAAKESATTATIKVM